MPAGLQVNNDDGSVSWISPQTRVARMIGALTLSPGDGYIDVPRRAGEKVMMGALITGDGTLTGGVVDVNKPNEYDPNGGRIIWSYSGAAGAATLVYGVY